MVASMTYTSPAPSARRNVSFGLAPVAPAYISLTLIEASRPAIRSPDWGHSWTKSSVDSSRNVRDVCPTSPDSNAFRNRSMTCSLPPMTGLLRDGDDGVRPTRLPDIVASDGLTLGRSFRVSAKARTRPGSAPEPRPPEPRGQREEQHRDLERRVEQPAAARIPDGDEPVGPEPAERQARDDEHDGRHPPRAPPRPEQGEGREAGLQQDPDRRPG